MIGFVSQDAAKIEGRDAKKQAFSLNTHEFALKRPDISYAMTTEENDIYKMYIYISYIIYPRTLDETCVIIEILVVLDIECYLKGRFPPFHQVIFVVTRTTERRRIRNSRDQETKNTEARLKTP